MTNTEKIRQEIERRIGAMYNFSSGYSALNTCRELLDFIDGLPKDKETLSIPEICKENDRFLALRANIALKIEKWSYCANRHLAENTRRLTCFIDAFKECLRIIDDIRGEAQEIRGEVQEIRGEVVKDWRGKLIVRASGIRDDLLLGDKVKIYIIKEE